MSAWGWTAWFGSAASVVGVVLLLTLMVAASLGGWVLTLVGMPGNWLIAAAALVYEFLAPEASRIELGRWCVIALFALAGIGEALETLTGSLSVAKKGGSRRGAFGALGGSMVGGIAGALGGSLIPVPVAGPVLAAVLFAALGAMIGAIALEKTTGKDMRQSVDIGFAAMWGRVLGSLSKAIVGAIMVALVLVGLLF